MKSQLVWWEQSLFIVTIHSVDAAAVVVAVATVVAVVAAVVLLYCYGFHLF